MRYLIAVTLLAGCSQKEVIYINTDIPEQQCWDSYPKGQLIEKPCPSGMDPKINQMVELHR